MAESDIQTQRLAKVPVSFSVRVCRQSMTLDQFLNWTPGTVISFDQPSASPLSMQIGEQEIGDGRAVKLGCKLGFRVQRIGDACISVETNE